MRLNLLQKGGMKPSQFQSKEFGIFVAQKFHSGTGMLQFLLIFSSITVGFVGGVLASFLTRNIVSIIPVMPVLGLGTHFFLQRLFFSYFQSERLRVDSYGFLALSEFLIILESTGSLSDAVTFIARGDYPNLSKICRMSLKRANLGYSLERELRFGLNTECYGETAEAFLVALDNWDVAAPLIPVLSEVSRERGIRKTEEEISRIDAIASLYSGIGTIVPPVIAVLLLISGQLNIFAVSILVCVLVFFAVFLRPWKSLEKVLWAGQHPHPTMKGSLFASVLAQNVLLEKSFPQAVLDTLGLVPSEIRKNDERFKQISAMVHLTSSFDQDLLQGIIKDYFGENSERLVSMTRRAVEFDQQAAGKQLLRLSMSAATFEALNDTIEARIKALRSKIRLLHLIDCISLGILSSVSFLFEIIPKIAWNGVAMWDMFPEKAVQLNFGSWFLLGCLVLAGSLYPVLLDAKTTHVRRLTWITGYFLVFCIFSVLPPLLLPY